MGKWDKNEVQNPGGLYLLQNNFFVFSFTVNVHVF